MIYNDNSMRLGINRVVHNKSIIMNTSMNCILKVWKKPNDLFVTHERSHWNATVERTSNKFNMQHCGQAWMHAEMAKAIKRTGKKVRTNKNDLEPHWYLLFRPFLSAGTFSALWQMMVSSSCHCGGGQVVKGRFYRHGGVELLTQFSLRAFDIGALWIFLCVFNAAVKRRVF